MRSSGVPLFFFHLREGSFLTRDEEGRELPDRQAAHAVALMSARDIMCGEVMQGRVDLSDSIEVVDEKGAEVLRLAFSEAVRFDR
jgi:hypothetical protein